MEECHYQAFLAALQKGAVRSESAVFCPCLMENCLVNNFHSVVFSASFWCSQDHTKAVDTKDATPNDAEVELMEVRTPWDLEFVLAVGHTNRVSRVCLV